MRVTTSRYETNLWSTHINNVRLAEPIRRLVCWRAGFSKSRGLSAIKRSFLSHYPPPPPPFFRLSYHFSRGQNRKSRSSVLLFSENKRKRVLRSLCNPIQSCFLPPGKGGERYGGHGLFITLEPLKKRPPKLHEIMYSTIPPVWVAIRE